MDGYRIKKVIEKNSAVIGLVLMLVLATMINSNFLSLENLTNVLRQASMNGIVAVGMTMVILCGSIDLSVGTMYGLSGFLALYFSNYSVIPAVLVPLAVGILVGVLNAFLINRVRIASFIATLSTMMAVKGTTLILTKENTFLAEYTDPAFNVIGRGEWGYLTVPSVLFILIAVVAAIVLNCTRIGRNMYAVGGNREAARMMGVNVERTLLFAHVFTGFMAALAGVVLVSRVGAAYPLAGEGKELDAIAACVIGGTALTGGKGRISGTFVGVLIIGLLTNIFNMQTALNSFWEKVITGSLVLTVVGIQSVNEHGISVWNRRGRQEKAAAAEK